MKKKCVSLSAVSVYVCMYYFAIRNQEERNVYIYIYYFGLSDPVFLYTNHNNSNYITHISMVIDFFRRIFQNTIGASVYERDGAQALRTHTKFGCCFAKLFLFCYFYSYRFILDFYILFFFFFLSLWLCRYQWIGSHSLARSESQPFSRAHFFI